MAASARAALTAIAAYAVGGLLWGVPLIVLSGGPAAYLGALANQGSEDFTGVAMLLTTSVAAAARPGAVYALLAPWAAWPLGVAVVVLPPCGLLRVRATRARARWSGWWWRSVRTSPSTCSFKRWSRRATPCRWSCLSRFLRSAALRLLPRPVGMSLVVCAAAASLLLAAAGPRGLRADRRTGVPAAGRHAGESRPLAGRRSPVLAMHRRQELDLRRPSVWAGGLPPFAQHLPAPPKHEWLELVKYWNRGGRAPIWFVADPPRSDLRARRPPRAGQRGDYRWPFAQTDLIGGVRPNVMDWHLIQPPDWYLGEGWSLTPETAGVARDEGRGPGRRADSGMDSPRRMVR